MTENRQVLDDFYLSVGIGIQFLDCDLKTVMATTSAHLLPLETLKQDIRATKQLTTLTYLEHIHFIVFPFKCVSKMYGYFVAGPFQSKCPTNKDMVFKPLYCLLHFEQLLKTVINKQLTPPSTSELYISKGIEYIQEHYHEDLTLDQVSKYLGINKCYFCSLFKRATDLTFSQFLNKVRIEASKQRLIHSTDSVLDIALAVGFNNHNYFTSTFKKVMGITPNVYRQKYAKANL